MTSEELRDRLAYWQRELRLQDWRITVAIVDEPHEFVGPPSEVANLSGQIQYGVAAYRHAMIRLLRPDHPTLASGAGPQWLAPHDLEQVLVHELLHLYIGDISGRSATSAEEMAIDTIAWTLVTLDRRARASLGFMPADVNAGVARG